MFVGARGMLIHECEAKSLKYLIPLSFIQMMASIQTNEPIEPTVTRALVIEGKLLHYNTPVLPQF